MPPYYVLYSFLIAIVLVLVTALFLWREWPSWFIRSYPTFFSLKIIPIFGPVIIGLGLLAFMVTILYFEWLSHKNKALNQRYNDELIIIGLLNGCVGLFFFVWGVVTM